MDKQEFLNGIDWEATLTLDFITKLYGYSLYDKQFIIDVLSEYENNGRDKVQYVYRLFVNLQEQQQRNELKNVAKKLAAQIDAEYERKVKEYEWKKKKYLQSLSEEELLQMLREKQCWMVEGLDR